MSDEPNAIDKLFGLTPEEERKRAKETGTVPDEGTSESTKELGESSGDLSSEVAPALGLFSDEEKVSAEEVSQPEESPSTESSVQGDVVQASTKQVAPTPQQILEDLHKSFPTYTKEQINTMVNGEIAKSGGLLNYEAALAVVGAELKRKQEEAQAAVQVQVAEPKKDEEPKKETTAAEFFSPATEVEPGPKETVEQPQEAVPEAKTVQPGSATALFSSEAGTIQVVEEAAEQPVVRKRVEITPSLPVKPEKFDVSPDEGGRGKAFMVYGDKGEAKTGLSLSFPGKIYAISFDRKTRDVWEEMYNKDPRIIVADAQRYMDYSSPEAWLVSSDISLQFIDALLDEAKAFEPDWILIDGTGEYIKMAEMTMRYRNSLGPYQGVPWTYWKERRLYIKQLHNKALGIAKFGIIYTAYVGIRETIEGEKIVKTKEQPKWIDVIEEQTDVVIRVRAKQFDDIRRFYATVESSKWKPIKTGRTVDITIPEGDVPDCLKRIVDQSR